MMKILLLFVFAMLPIVFAKTQLSNTLDSLQMFQGANGGFNDEQLTSATQASAPGDLTTTRLALFLVSVYGQYDKITISGESGVFDFLRDRMKTDGGYSATVTAESDILSTRDALLIYHFLGSKTPNAQDVLAFTRSLYDEKTGLYAEREGEAGSIRGTAAALQVFTLLGTLKAPFVTNNFEKINEVLREALVDADTETFFNFGTTTDSAITNNFYAVSIGYATEFEFANPENFANYFLTLQKPSGGFSSGGDATYKNTFEAVSAIAILSAISKQDFLARIKPDTLESFLEGAGPVLSDVAYASQTQVLTGSIKKHFKLDLILESESGQVLEGGLVEGQKFRPTVKISGYEDELSPRFIVEIDTAFGEEKDRFTLVYSKERSIYVSSELFDTRNNLGQISFYVSARFSLVSVGTVILDFSDSRTVGYHVNIAAKAVNEATGREVSPGEDVSIGTDFKFDVTLSTATKERPSVGKLDAVLNVIDSSGAILDQQKQSFSSESVLSFQYTLTKASFPSGLLTFSVEVSDDKVGVHSKGKVSYRLTSAMVASEIRFSGFSRSKAAVYKIGEKVEVKIVPASFPDLRNVHPVELNDVDGTEIEREFVMDVLSASGNKINSIRGVQGEDGKEYVFSLSLPPRLDSFGSSSVAFRYVPKFGEPIDLQAYDSDNSELFEDVSQLNFTVPADIRIVEVKESPKGDDFFYGNNIAFKFKLRDENSGQFVKAGTSGANVFLSLVHKDEKGGSFSSVVRPAVQAGDFFEINWRITPNAVPGPAEIALYAQGVNSQRLPLLDSEGKPVAIKVKIGGKIDFSEETYSSSSSEAEKTTLITTFRLTCQGNSLSDAQLYAQLLRPDGSVAADRLPVTSVKEIYQTSFTDEHDNIPDGTYKFLFFRDLQDKKESSSSSASEPLFVVNLSHRGAGSSSLPFSPQIFIVTLLVAALGYVAFKRSDIVANS